MINVVFDLIISKLLILQLKQSAELYRNKQSVLENKVIAIDVLYTLDSASLLVKLKPRAQEYSSGYPHLNRWRPLANKRLKPTITFII